MSDITTDLFIAELLRAASDNDREARRRLGEMFYPEFRKLAKSISPGNGTMCATALVNQWYVKLVTVDKVDARSRSHFLRLGAEMMRNLLRDHYRRKKASCRGGDRVAVPLEEWVALDPKGAADFLEMDEALEQLKQTKPRHAQVVQLRVFGGLSVPETAEVLQITVDRVNRDFAQARVLLHKMLTQ